MDSRVAVLDLPEGRWLFRTYFTSSIATLTSLAIFLLIGMIGRTVVSSVQSIDWTVCKGVNVCQDIQALQRMNCGRNVRNGSA